MGPDLAPAPSYLPPGSALAESHPAHEPIRSIGWGIGFDPISASQTLTHGNVSMVSAHAFSDTPP